MNRQLIAGTVVLSLASLASGAEAPGDLKGFDLKVKTLAQDCRDAAVRRIENLINSGALTQAQVFDTFYIPIKNTYPQKFHTKYDPAFDESLRPLLDDYLKKNPRLVFVILVDKNGYVPTHNSAFSKPSTGNKEVDARDNRTKQMFNDRTGLAAARNTGPFLLQEYQRDTGETMLDLSVPLVIRGQHWGCLRIAYRKE